MFAAQQQNYSRSLVEAFRRTAFWIFFLVLGAGALLAQRPLGTDVSHWQASINWPGVKDTGVTFAWAKATEGTYYTDPTFSANEDGAKGVGIYIGAYHFARPSANPNITGPNSADSEAAYFWSVAGNYIQNGGSYLVPMLDWEDPYATNGYHGLNVFTTSFMSAWVNEWCNTVSNYAQASGVTIKPIVYTGTWYSTPGSTYPGVDASVTGWPSWIASYNLQSVQTGSPTSTYPWPTWAVWQYADTNWSGGDSDVFNGSLAGLGGLVIGGSAEPIIIGQPLWRAVDTGGNVTFPAVIWGNGTLNYQWTFGSANIPGATNAAFTLTNARTTDTGGYALVVSNYSGSVTSSPAWLVVYPVQTTVFADDFETNSATNWIVNQSSADTSAAFGFDYSTLGIPAAPHSNGGTTNGLLMKANISSKVVAALSLSPTNRSFAGDYRLRFDAWINVNGPFPGGGAGSTEFLTAGIGTAGNRAEWTGNASADGYYFSIDGDGGAGASSTTSGDFCAYAGATLFGKSSGVYIAGTDTSARDNFNYYYTRTFVNGQSAPTSQQSSYPQQRGTLAPGTIGLGWHDVIVSKRGNTVDWVVDGVRLACVANASFTASNVCVGFWDPFASLSDNNNLSFGLVDNVRVEIPAVAPILTLQNGTTFRLIGSGQTGATYILETSTNLAGWTSLTSLTATNNAFEFDFVPPDGDAQRFFRARVGP